jgi:type III secretion system FlhB-like substrate exporter
MFIEAHEDFSVLIKSTHSLIEEMFKKSFSSEIPSEFVEAVMVYIVSNSDHSKN